MFDAALHVRSQTEDDQGRRHHSGPPLAYLFEADPMHAGEHSQTVVPASQVESYKSPSPQSDAETTLRLFSKRVFSKRCAKDMKRKYLGWKQARKQEFYDWELDPDVLRLRHVVFVISWFV